MKYFLSIMLFLVITFSIFAQCPSAGPDAIACGQTTQLHSLGVSGYWTGPVGAIYSPSNTDPNANVFIPSYVGASVQATFTWNETGCTPADDVVITFIKPPHSEAGMSQSVCGTTMQLAADTLGSGIVNGWWTSSVPGILITPSALDPIPWNPIVDASVLGSGFWVNSQRAVWFYWHGQNSQACFSTDSVLVTFYQKPDANAGLDTAICGQSYDLGAAWSITGHSGIWSMQTVPPSPGSSNFVPANDPNGVVTVSSYGIYYFVWKEININNSVCFDRDTVRVEFKVVPMPSAGLDITVCGSWAHICATPSVTGGQWSGPAGIAYYDIQNGTYTPSQIDSACTWIRYPSENDLVTMYWFESNGVCTGYDSVNVYFASIQPAISLGDPADSVVCGPVCPVLNAQLPAYGYGYWMDTVMNTQFIPSANVPDPYALIDTGGINYSGIHSFYWITVNGICRDTSNVVRVRFKESPRAVAGTDITVCGQWAHLNATPAIQGVGQWICLSGGVEFYDTINGNLMPTNSLLPSTWIKSSSVNVLKMMRWGVLFDDCLSVDTIDVSFQDCGFAGPDDITCGQSYTFNAIPNFINGSSFQWSCLTAPVLFSNSTLLNPQVILPNYSSVSTVYTFVLTETNLLNSFSNSDTVSITFFDGCNEIKGTVFYDLNLNGTFDNGDQSAANIVVKIDNDYVATDLFGKYNYIALSGNHNISIPSLPNSIQASPNTHTAVFSGSGAIDSLNNFALTLCTDTSLSIYGYLTNARPGFTCMHNFNACNNGQYSIITSIKIIIDSRITFDSASIAPDVINGNVLEWNNILLPANFYRGISINTTIPSTLAIGTLLKDSAYVFPVIGDIQPLNNSTFPQRAVAGSFDPNEKTVSPINGLTPAQLAAGNSLDYTIHFQNTGTDTAFTVVLKDTLSSLLDVGTLQIIGSSHPVNMQILDHGTVIWTFPNILLPDSNVNEPLSNGYISYSIKPKTNLTVGDLIENTAYIYFDYNLPVVTNTTSSYIYDPISVSEQTIDESNLYVSPNPFTDNCNIHFYLQESSPVVIEIYDLLGNKVATICNETKQQGNHTINYSFQNNTTEQFYLIRMVTNEGQSVKRVIKL
ncbi:MAG: T9SS type A sorting domain-containing protein [Bacteroidia bacterium]|nr:T9SS type A sorting domain-containing protein [Bacteroidia bacterium]